jgi:hypothetical protein
MAKTGMMGVRVTGEEKAHYEAEAKKQAITLGQYMTEALEFYSSFDVHFLEHIYDTAQKMKLPMPKVIQNLLVAYTNAELAQMEVFKIGSVTYRRAFQFSEKDGSLIEGIEHMDLVYEQTKKDLLLLKTRLEQGVKKGEPVFIRNEDAVMMAAAYAAREKEKEKAELRE